VTEDRSEEWFEKIVDTPHGNQVKATAERYQGRVWSVRSDSVDFGTSTHQRDVLLHPGAVAVIALDEDDRVLLIRQYRHPVAMYLFEPPAGLLDVEGEPPWETAARELAEESGYGAQSWHTLVDMFNSPGGSSEAIRIYLARELHPLPDGRPRTDEAEEAHLPRVWVPLHEAVAMVLSGHIGSPSAVCGILAAQESKNQAWRSLRPADAPWTARANLEQQGRVHRM
jgi:ADP-ribose pyrophosphatase